MKLEIIGIMICFSKLIKMCLKIGVIVEMMELVMWLIKFRMLGVLFRLILILEWFIIVLFRLIFRLEFRILSNRLVFILRWFI